MKRPTLSLRVTLTITDRQGRVVKRRSFRSRSYILAMLDILCVQMSGQTVNIYDIAHASKAVTQQAPNLNFQAGVGVTNNGIVVGVGNWPVALDDYKLASQIAHGIGPNQLQHGLQQFTAPATSGLTRYFTAVRSFVNSSGAEIIVNEAGIYAKGGSPINYFCIVRDVIIGGIAVPNGKTLTVQYTPQVTV